MQFMKVETAIFQHRRMVDLKTPDAVALYFVGLAQCAQALTDGFIYEGLLSMFAVLAKLSPEALEAAIEELVRVGLWEESEHGFLVHDYLDYQCSRNDVIANKEAERKRKQDERDRKRRQLESEPKTTSKRTSKRTSKSVQPDESGRPEVSEHRIEENRKEKNPDPEASSNYNPGDLDPPIPRLPRIPNSLALPRPDGNGKPDVTHISGRDPRDRLGCDAERYAEIQRSLKQLKDMELDD